VPMAYAVIKANPGALLAITISKIMKNVYIGFHKQRLKTKRKLMSRKKECR
jgi:hypothetical protein